MFVYFCPSLTNILSILYKSLTIIQTGVVPVINIFAISVYVFWSQNLAYQSRALMLQCDATHVQASPGLSASAGSGGGRQGSREVTSMGGGRWKGRGEKGKEAARRQARTVDVPLSCAAVQRLMQRDTRLCACISDLSDHSRSVR